MRVAPKPIKTLWAGFGGDCETGTLNGDPIVRYDRAADRFIFSQFALPNPNSGPNYMCLAVSLTPDPTGAYFRYSLSYTGLPDYPKLGVWPDGYYLTMNLFEGGFAGAQVCALDRANMLIGAPATQQCFNAGTANFGLLPADLDGAIPPPTGSPNYLIELGGNTTDTTLDFWTFHVDWTTPANSTLTGPTILTVAQYTQACTSSTLYYTCIPQASPGNLLASLGDRVMYRSAYRNFGDHESLVVNHSVAVSSAADSPVGVRWYELRLPGGTPTVYQQGTYAPDSNYRWMGSIAMDQAGNMALGFSLSGNSLFPGIHYTGRLAGDALGQMTQGEGTIIDGTGVETGKFFGGQLANRWGDYSSMSVDPVDDCTFWYTNQYYPTNGVFTWSTRIATFTFPGCQNAAFTLSANPTSQTVIAGQSTSTPYTVTITPSGGFSGGVTCGTTGLPAGATGTFNPNPATGSSALTVATTTATAPGSYTVTITGTSGSLSHSINVTLVVNPAADFTLSASPASQTVIPGQSTSFTVTVTPSGGFTDAVNFNVSGLPRGASGTSLPIRRLPAVPR